MTEKIKTEGTERLTDAKQKKTFAAASEDTKRVFGGIGSVTESKSCDNAAGCAEKQSRALTDDGRFAEERACSLSGKDRVIDYIKNQKIHHQRINFQDELRAMLHIHGIAYEEDSLWKD